MPIGSSDQEGIRWIPEYCLAQLHRPRCTTLWIQADLGQGAAHKLLLRMFSIDGLDELPHRISHVPYAGNLCGCLNTEQLSIKDATGD